MTYLQVPGSARHSFVNVRPAAAYQLNILVVQEIAPRLNHMNVVSVVKILRP
jgi:hypothetical protein